MCDRYACVDIFYPNPPGPGARDEDHRTDTDKEAIHTDRQYWTREQVRDEERRKV